MNSNFIKNKFSTSSLRANYKNKFVDKNKHTVDIDKHSLKNKIENEKKRLKIIRP